MTQSAAWRRDDHLTEFESEGSAAVADPRQAGEAPPTVAPLQTTTIYLTGWTGVLVLLLLLGVAIFAGVGVAWLVFGRR